MDDKHYPVLCKYDKTIELPALVIKKCAECSDPLCSQCGHIYHGLLLCNECHKMMETEDLNDPERQPKEIPF